MVTQDNNYTRMQEAYYQSTAEEMNLGDHKHHNNNPDYWELLLGMIKSNPEKWKDMKALDFGCGTGRNMENLLKLAQWNRVDGVDISEKILGFADTRLAGLGYKKDENYKLFKSTGIDAGSITEWYDFIMSTIVFQHIAVHEIRFNILKELSLRMNHKGILSLQMGFGDTQGAVGYFDNYYEAKETNSKCDVKIVDFESELRADLSAVGFKNIKHKITKSFSDRHSDWIFVTASK